MCAVGGWVSVLTPSPVTCVGRQKMCLSVPGAQNLHGGSLAPVPHTLPLRPTPFLNLCAKGRVGENDPGKGGSCETGMEGL